MKAFKPKRFVKYFIFLTLFLIYQKAISQTTNQTLDWTTQTWTAGSLTGALLVNDFPIIVTIEDLTGSAFLGTPGIGLLYQGDQSSVDHSFVWASVLQRIRTTGTVKFTFELDGGALNDGYENVSFKLFDADGVSTNNTSVKPRQEKFVINGYNGTTLISPTITGSTVHTVNPSNTVTSNFTDTDITGGNSADGVVNVSFGTSKLTKFEIIFSILQTDPIPLTNTSTPGFSIYNLLFTTPKPLPLSLHSFKATLPSNENSILLSWERGSNEDRTIYIIEKSNDAIVFDSIGVANDNTELNGIFYFKDNYLTPNTPVYYRIKEIKLDKEVNYSRIISVVRDNNLQNNFNSAVYPNPINKTFFVTTHDSQKLYDFQLIDSQGFLIKSLSPNQKNNNLYRFEIDNNSIIRGIYILLVSEKESGKRELHRVFIE